VETNPIEEESPPFADGVSDTQRLYGGYYYEHDFGVPYERNDHWLDFFGMMANHIAIELQPRSVLDAGCAIGLLVEALRGRGIDAYGVDVSEYAISRADPSIREYVWQASLTEPLPRRYDLVTCIEVVEHIPSAEALAALDNICNVTDRLLLSSSPVDFGEPTHINVKQPEDWSALLASRGFFREVDMDVSFLTPWAALYRRRSDPVPELVRTYERQLWRLSSELRDVRSTVLSLQSRLEEGYRVSQSGSTAYEELIECRDEITGLQAELGETLGRVRRLDADMSRYRIASDQLDAFTRSPVWRIYRPYRSVRRWIGAKVRRLLRRVR
jgi:SAM-dependent methyltransferase